jgi:hypothetical protein
VACRPIGRSESAAHRRRNGLHWQTRSAGHRPDWMLPGGHPPKASVSGRHPYGLDPDPANLGGLGQPRSFGFPRHVLMRALCRRSASGP